jgi:hypothetical protein
VFRCDTRVGANSMLLLRQRKFLVQCRTENSAPALGAIRKRNTPARGLLFPFLFFYLLVMAFPAYPGKSLHHSTS